jgi:dTDP-4-amino-4,6-dideoxygalactose transaminase
MAAGVKRGETVVTVPNTFIATTEAISQAGALIDFVDVDERTYNLDPEKLTEYIEHQCRPDLKTGRAVNRKTGSPVAAVVPVHLYGQTACMDPIQELAEKHRFVIIEDACQAQGAEHYSKRRHAWKRAGSMGVAAAFSFYPGKNLGACGEAGAVTTDDEELARKVRMLRDHGQSRKYVHEMEGYNGRLDAIQAGILRTKLKHLQEWNEKRQQKALRYGELMEGLDGVIVPYQPSWVKPVYHLYVIRTDSRDELQQHLQSNGVGSGLHYPVPLHLQRAYAALGYCRGAFSVSERLAGEILSLPMYPGLSDDQQARVVNLISEFLLSTGVKLNR